MAQDSAGVAQAIRHLYDAVGAPGQGGVDLDALREWVGAEHVVLTRVSAAPDGTGAAGGMAPGRAHWRGCRHFRAGSAPLQGGHPEHWAALADHRAWAGLGAAGRALRTSTVVGRERMRESALYQELLRPLDGGLAAVACWADGDGWTSLSFCRSLARGHDFGDAELDRLQQLVPHIRQAERLHARLARADQLALTALDMLHLSPRATVLLDRHARPMFINQAARALLMGDAEANANANADADDGAATLGHRLLRLSAQGVHACDPADDARLQRALRTAIALGAAGLSAGLPRADAALSVALSARGAGGRHAGAGKALLLELVPAATVAPHAGDACAALLIHAPGHHPAHSLAPEHITQAWGLTPREAELATLLAQGRDLATAARHMALTQGTARQYLKQVFRKLGVRRQAELVRVLAG